LLPFSRTHEAEADLIGLDLMARAGFDPAQSVDLWENMRRGGGGQPLEFFSTHPSHSTRIRGLNQRIPAAQQLREEARTQGVIPRCGP
jgi:predicted Zn-dependent protease